MNFFIKPLLTIICFALFSCNSDNKLRNGHTTQDKDTTNVLSVYNAGAERKVQIFEINTSIQQKINGKQGTVVTFPAQCFGKVQGMVKIELIECYSIQEMILNGLSTQTTDGKLLESDGMIYLNALNEKGDTLKIKQEKVKVQMQTKQRKENIQIFEGINTSSGITWDLTNEKLKIGEISNIIKQNQNNGPQIEVEDPEHNFTIQPKTGQSQIVIDKQIKNEFLVNYVFNITEMGWINCDRYIEGETQDLFVSVGKEQENVSIYLVLDKRNSNVMPRNPKAVNGKFEYRNIPVKESFTLVALATKGDKIYFGMANHVTNDGKVNCPDLKPVTRQELTDLLMRKFGENIWSRPSA
jgi:hypothetical protein